MSCRLYKTSSRLREFKLEFSVLVFARNSYHDCMRIKKKMAYFPSPVYDTGTETRGETPGVSVVP